MIKHKELYQLLKTLKIPVTYDHFNDDKDIFPPFTAYREQRPDVFNADDKNLIKFNNFEIELVTDKKDIELEEAIETLLNNNEIPFDKSDETWDNDEKTYHVFYEI